MKFFQSVALVAGLAFITAGASAQTSTATPPAGMSGGQGMNMDPNQRAQKMTEQVKQNVTGITPDQESKILAAEQTFAKGAQDASISSNGDRDAMRSKIQPLRETRDAQLKGILTADQYGQYQKWQASHPMGGGGHRNSGN